MNETNLRIRDDDGNATYVTVTDVRESAGGNAYGEDVVDAVEALFDGRDDIVIDRS